MSDFTSTNLKFLSLLTGLSLSGCAWLGYENERFSTTHVRVVHSEQHCKNNDKFPKPRIPNATFIKSRVDGLGGFVATKTAWEIQARQLAAESDADIAVIRPCEGDSRAFDYRQLELWRTNRYTPVIREETPPPGSTLVPPPGTTYARRLEDIFHCIETARITDSLVSAENISRLANLNPTDFFSSERHFPGYAKVDRYFRPTRADPLRLSMITSQRLKADWAASIYLGLSQEKRLLFSRHYLVCLMNRGYRL